MLPPKLGSLAPWTCSNVFAAGKFNVIVILDLLCVKVGSLLSVPGGLIFHMLSYLQVFHSCFWPLVDLFNLGTHVPQFQKLSCFSLFRELLLVVYYIFWTNSSSPYPPVLFSRRFHRLHLLTILPLLIICNNLFEVLIHAVLMSQILYIMCERGNCPNLSSAQTHPSKEKNRSN